MKSKSNIDIAMSSTALLHLVRSLPAWFRMRKATLR